MEPAAVLRLLLTAEGVKETQLQLARVNAEAKRTADSTDKLEKSFSRANNRTAEFNKNMNGLRNVVSLVKFPALIAGASAAAQAVGALGAAGVGLVSALAPLSGALVGQLGLYSAMGQGLGVVHLAFANVTQALGGSKKAMQALTPAQKTFVDQLKGMKGQLDSLRNTAAQNLFPGLTQGIKVAEPLMGRLKPIIAATAKELGNLAVQAAHAAVSMGPQLSRIGQTNVKVIGNLGQAAIAGGKGLITLLDAARPLTLWMSEMIKRGAQWVDSQLKQAAAAGKLASFFDKTRMVMTELGHILANLAVGFYNIGKAAYPLGAALLKSFENLTAQFRTWTESVRGRNEIAHYFEAARAPAYQLFGLVGDLGKAFLRITAPTGQTAGMIGGLRSIVRILANVVQTAGRTLGPALIQLLINLAHIFQGLAGTSGPLTLLIKVVVQITGVIAKLVDHNPALSTTMSLLGGGVAVFKALHFAVSPLVGPLSSVARIFGKELPSAGSVFKKGFAADVAGGVSEAEGAAKSGAPKILDVFKSTFTKVNLFRGFGIALGGALVGGLVTMIAKGLAADDPTARGRVWAQGFLKGVDSVHGSGRGGPLVNPLPIPDQRWFTQQAGLFVGKYVKTMDDKTFLERFSRGATYLLNNPKIKAETDQAAAGLATAVAKSFSQRWSQVRFPTQPAFIQDVMMYLEKLPPWARGEAAKALTQYAAGLEEKKKLPVGATTDTIVAIERQWPHLVNYLGSVTGKSAKVVADNFAMPEAKKKLSDLLANLRSQWGLWNKWNTGTNLSSIRQNFKTTWDYLKWVIANRTGDARREAVKELDQLRTSHAAILLGMRNITGDRMSEIADIIGSKTQQAAKQGGAHVKSFAEQVAHQEASAHTATSGHLTAIANIIGSKTQQAANQGGAHMKSWHDQSVHWEALTQSATGSHLGAIANIIGSKTQQAANQGGAHMKSFHDQTVHYEAATHSATSNHMFAISNIISAKSAQAADEANTNFQKFKNNVGHGTQEALNAVNSGTSQILHAVSTGLGALGSAIKINIKLNGHIPGFERGGEVTKAAKGLYQFGEQGRGGRDSIPVNFGGNSIMVGSGEMGAVFTRHQKQIADQMMAPIGGLTGLFKNATKPHYMATGGYVFPWPAGTRTERVDQGWDAAMPVGSPIGAIGKARIGPMFATPWLGQPFMSWELLEGPAKGRWVYLAEQIRPRVRTGQVVNANTAVATFAPSGTGIEMGWTTAGEAATAHTLADIQGGYHEGQITAAGTSFKNFLLGLAHGKINLSGGVGSFVPTIKAPKVTGGGKLGQMAQAALNKVTAQANKYILAHEPTFGAPGNLGSIPAGSGPVEKQMYDAGTKLGLTKIAIAGMIGNAFQESGLNPNLNVPGGRGLFSWNPGGNPDAAKVVLGNVPEQMALAVSAINKAAFDATSSPAAAATWFEQNFEHADPAKANMPNRIAAAQRAYSQGYAQGGFLPPYGGSFAQGGIVPGARGEARTIIAHGGETVSSNNTGGPLINIENMSVLDTGDATMLAHKLAWLVEA